MTNHCDFCSFATPLHMFEMDNHLTKHIWHLEDVDSLLSTRRISHRRRLWLISLSFLSITFSVAVSLIVTEYNNQKTQKKKTNGLFAFSSPNFSSSFQPSWILTRVLDPKNPWDPQQLNSQSLHFCRIVVSWADSAQTKSDKR